MKNLKGSRRLCRRRYMILYICIRAMRERLNQQKLGMHSHTTNSWRTYTLTFQDETGTKNMISFLFNFFRTFKISRHNASKTFSFFFFFACANGREKIYLTNLLSVDLLASRKESFGQEEQKIAVKALEICKNYSLTIDKTHAKNSLFSSFNFPCSLACSLK